MAMAAAGASGASGSRGERLRLLCSHGGRFVPCGPDGGGLRYVGGETRALVVPREIPFRELAARLGEMAGAAGAAVRLRYPLADEGLHDVLVSVTCDEDLAHMLDEYDRLLAKRPSASFRVFVSTAAAWRHAVAGGLPILAEQAQPRTIRRVQSEQMFSSRAHLLRPHHDADPGATMRRAKSTQELAGAGSLPPCFHHQQRPQCCCCCCHHHRRRNICAPAPPPSPPMRPLPSMSNNLRRQETALPVSAAPFSMSKNSIDLLPGRQETAPPRASAARTAGRLIFADAEKGKARCTDAEVAVHEEKRAIWEFE